MVTESVQDVHTCAEIIASKLPAGLSRTAVKLYTALVGAALETAQRKGYSENVTHVVMHLPLEVLASVCGVHRVTAWRHLPALKALGVLDYRPLKGTLRGATVNTGTLFQVRLNPVSGSKCRLGYADLKHRWRDLQRDVLRKRTAFRQLQQSVKESTKQLDISKLTYWTFPETKQTPLATDGCTQRGKPDLYALLGLKSVPKPERNKAVGLAAAAMCQALNDHGSKNFYCKLLYCILGHFDATGQDYSYQEFLAASRAITDRVDGFARRPGGLLVSRIKAAGLYDELLQT